ncbi:serine-threonine kinase family protein [Salix suchowensis]|nr:serine-threonine kinase family protein [Salix suchowensis]
MHANICFLFSLACFTALFNELYVSANGAQPQSLSLNCGSENGGTDGDGRKWESDVKYITGKHPHARAQYQDSSIDSEKTRYWLRLSFYPSEYSGLDISDSYFSVVAGGVTLLNNFSASITAQALTQAYLIKEYSLAPMNSRILNVTFKPADKPDAFAFINAIELVPTPDLFGSGTMVGFSDQTFDAMDGTLQTMYRLNVAGQTWYNDAPYLFGAATGVNLQSNDSFEVRYGELAESVAPPDVYRTARGMGYYKDVNMKFNLTWLFQADANFTYVVRLHFCEFQLTKVNQKADPNAADIIGWTGEKGVPTYKDYAVFVKDREGDEEIRVDLHPSTYSKPEFYDASLNGIEIFKMSDRSNNLAGPNPVLSEMLANHIAKASHKAFKTDNKIVMGTVGGVGALLFAVVCVAVYQRTKRIPVYGNSHTVSKSSISGKSSQSSHLSTLAQGLCRHFTLPEMQRACKNFDESNVIGVGGFGKVYKGVIDQATKVAIKRSNPQSEQGVNEFMTEIEMLSKLRHKHLVSLIGFCDEDGEMCLHLYNTKKPRLAWKQRLEVCIGAARGLHYLHTGAKYTIIHRDVKSTNILLDENWVAKVSDFGLSKTGPDMDKGHVSTVVKGSFGYLDPEYFRRQQLTEKSDVYSFGVVLFEALCGRPALNPSLPKEQVSLADWALHCQKKGIIEDIIDPHIKGKITPECLKKFAETADKCLAESGPERPNMGDVLWNLEFALQLQDNPEGSKHRSQGEGNETSEESTGNRNLEMHRKNLSLGSISEVNEGSEDSGDIFSQIVNPKGR